MKNDNIDGLLFGPGLPGRGSRIHIQFAAHELVVQVPDGPIFHVSYQDLDAQPGGWRGDGLLLHWEERGEAWSLSVNEPNEVAAFLAHAPRRVSGNLGKTTQRVRRSHWLLRGSMALVVLAVLMPFILVGLLLFRAEAVVGVAVERIPIEWEQRLGELVSTQVLAQDNLWPIGEATQALEGVMQRLLQQVDTSYEFAWYLVENPQPNAFAYPGAIVVVHTGLLREMDNAEELAGVLAHEIVHVVQRDGLRILVHGLGLRAVLALILNGQGALGELTADLANRAAGLRYSRRQEMQADVGALAILQAERIDPTGLVTFFERLASRGAEPPQFLSTHPPSQERALRCRAAIDPELTNVPLPYDWQAVLQEVERGSVSAPRSNGL